MAPLKITLKRLNGFRLSLYTIRTMMVTNSERIFLLIFLKKCKEKHFSFKKKGIFDLMNSKYFLLLNRPFIEMSRKTCFT